MFKEYELVKLTKDIPSVRLKAGARGTIVMVYPDYPGVYEVEFLDPDGRTLALLTLQEEDLERY